jgi:penicillin G amidase
MARGLAGTIASGVTLAGTLFVCARGVSGAGIPPIGPLLDPVNGAVASVRNGDLPTASNAQIPGLSKNTRVLFDPRGVPHIYADNSADAYRALGYAVARDRLFQMELSYRAAAGSIAELAGAKALPLDIEARRLGLNWAAERKWAAMDSNNSSRRAMEAFADGVNAYRASLTPATTPVEYKLLGATPIATWDAKNAVYLLMRMALTLANDPEDLRRTRVASLVGRTAADALFPRNMPLQEPIQPVDGRTAAREAWAALPNPGAPDTSIIGSAKDAMNVADIALAMPGAEQTGDALGSNNWAAGPGRTASGGALLAGDPHLDLSLPSIWYEAHIVIKDSVDVYGVTFPGAPGIVIGFNQNVAWTFTNTGGDVSDFFAEQVDDAKSPTKYMLDGQWQKLVLRIESFRNPSGDVIRVDTVYHTHRGPMRRENGRWLSFRWTAHDASNEMEGFEKAARATSVAEWQAAMLIYKTPTQNMLVADRTGTIALRSQGTYPVRPDSTGGYVRDGRTRKSDWAGELPVEQMPQVVNPAQGFIASANQQPFDPASVSRYIGGSWPDPWRALRINEILRADDKLTPDTFRKMHMDPMNVRARLFTPFFVRAAERSGNAKLGAAAKMLRDWDYRYELTSQVPVLFEATMRRVVRNTWDELSPAADKPPIGTPSGSVLLELLRDSTSTWWDDRRTSGTTESRDGILAAALESAFDSLTTKLGPVGEPWAWSNTGGINVNHLVRLPGFSRPHLAVTSGPGTLAPASGTGDGSHGASWRMVVELTKDRRTAWAIYPGGQSGNPASRRYDDRLEKWRTGQLDSLIVPATEAAFAKDRIISTLDLRP